MALTSQRGATVGSSYISTFQVTVPTRAHWTDTIRPLLDPNKHWRIYADGYWKVRTTPHHDHYFSMGDCNNATLRTSGGQQSKKYRY